MSSGYVDVINGLEANNGTTRLTPKKYLQSITWPVATDDIMIAKTPDPVEVGTLTASWSQGSYYIYPSAMPCLYIESFNTGWSFGTGITNNYGSSWQRDDACLELTTSSTCPTGTFALATKDFGSDQNWSTHRGKSITQVSYWWYTSTTQTTGNFVIRFYDSSSTLLATFTPPSQTAVFQAKLEDFTAALPTNVRYMKIEWTPATKIGSGLKIRVDNMVGCYPSNDPEFVWLGSLIGHSNSRGAGGDDTNQWYCLQTIQSSYFVLDNTRTFISTSRQGYSGETRSNVQLYKSEPGILDAATSVAVTTTETVDKIHISGGWDFTQDPPVQNGITILDAMKIPSSTALTLSSKNGIELNHIDVCRSCSTPISLNGKYGKFYDTRSYGASSTNFLSGTFTSFKDMVASTHGYGGFSLGSLTDCTIENLTLAGCRGDSNNVFTGSGTIVRTGMRNIQYINSGYGSSIDLALSGNNELRIADSTFRQISFAGVSQILLTNCGHPAPTNTSPYKGTYMSSDKYYGVEGRKMSWMYDALGNSLIMGDPVLMGGGTDSRMQAITMSVPNVDIEHIPFNIPVKVDVPIKIKFNYHCVNTNVTIKLTVYDNDWERTKLLDAVSITAVADSNEHTFLSDEITAFRTGNVIAVLSFSTTNINSIIGVWGIGVTPQSSIDLGGPEILIDGKLSTILLNGQIEHSYVG